MLKYIKATNQVVNEDGSFNSCYKWKHWTFYIRKSYRDKTFTIGLEGSVIEEVFSSYFKKLTGYRNINTAEKAIDSAIRDFIKYIKAKDE